MRTMFFLSLEMIALIALRKKRQQTKEGKLRQHSRKRRENIDQRPSEDSLNVETLRTRQKQIQQTGNIAHRNRY